jgi:hypothetical protein
MQKGFQPKYIREQHVICQRDACGSRAAVWLPLAYSESISIAPLLNLGCSWRWMVNITPRPLYHRSALSRRQGGSHSRFGRFGEEKIYFLCRDLNPVLVAIPTALFQVLQRKAKSVLLKGKKFLSLPKRPDRLRGPPSLLFNEYRRFFLRGVTCNIQRHLVPRLRMSGTAPLLRLYAFTFIVTSLNSGFILQ